MLAEYQPIHLLGRYLLPQYCVCTKYQCGFVRPKQSTTLFCWQVLKARREVTLRLLGGGQAALDRPTTDCWQPRLWDGSSVENDSCVASQHSRLGWWRNEYLKKRWQFVKRFVGLDGLVDHKYIYTWQVYHCRNRKLIFLILNSSA